MSVIRPAGLNERRCIARESLGLYGSIITVATYMYVASSQQEAANISVEDLVRILKTCANKHPVLSTCIRDGDSEKPLLVSVPLDDMDLERHIRVLDLPEEIDHASDDPADEALAKRIQSILTEAHNEPFANYDTVPPWRVYIFRPKTPSSSIPLHLHLAFAISHALVDGSSGIAFHSTFARALEQLSTNAEYSETEGLPSATCPLPPSLESAVKMPISWSFLLRPALNEFLPSWLTSALGMKDTSTHGTWCGAAVRPKRNESMKLLTTAVRTALVSPRTMQRALEVCKRHNARFTGLVTYLTARNLAHALRHRNQDHENFLAEIAIDLRKCIPDAANRMANYVSATTVAISVLPHQSSAECSLTSEDWHAIQVSTEHLAKRSSTLADQPTALLRYLPNIRAWVAKQSTKLSSVSFGVSNLGVVRGLSPVPRNAAETGDWTVEDITFSQSADGMGPPFNLNVASVKGGPTALVITWWPGMLGVEDEETFIEEILEGVLKEMITL